MSNESIKNVPDDFPKNAGTQFDPNIARIFAEALLEKPWEE
ncbi:MAG: hypothetical protein ACYDIA_05925 [Candidatus Humimicrobiaceae bacterium]